MAVLWATFMEMWVTLMETAFVFGAAFLTGKSTSSEFEHQCTVYSGLVLSTVVVVVATHLLVHCCP